MIFRILVVLFFFASFNTLAQDQREADSLKLVLNQGMTFSDSAITNLLYRITIKSSSPEDKLEYSDLLLEYSKSYEPIYYSIKVYYIRGVAYRLMGDLEQSLQNLFQSAQLAADNNHPVLEAEAYGEIANSYVANEDFQNSLEYQIKAIDIIRIHGTQQQLAISLLNTGFNYYSLEKLDSALVLYNEAEPIFEDISMSIGKAYIIGNRALVYWKQGNYDRAEKGLLEAIGMLEPLGDQFGMADYHNQLGSMYLEGDNIEKTIFHTEKALSMAEDLGLKEQIRDAVLLLSRLYTKRGRHKEALHYQTLYIAYKDSIANSEQTKEIANIRTDFEVSLREKEIDLLEKRETLNRTYMLIAAILLLLSVVLLLYFRQRFLNTRLVSTNERKQHDDKIKDLLNSQETKALQSMVQGRDNERRRLAQELHNHFGSLLATIKVNINGIDEGSIPNHGTLTTLVDQACADIRNISHSLNMGISENFGLVPALKELTTHLQKSNGLKVEFAASMCDGLMDSQNEIVIYRIVQELVSNVLKHAAATKLSVLLTCFEEENLVNILVHDNGKGFNTQVAKKNSEGIGLNSLKQMVANYDGEITFDSNPTSGTTVNIDLPLTLSTNMI